LGRDVGEMAAGLRVVGGGGEEKMGDDGRAGQTELEAGYDITELHEAPGGPSVLRCPDCGGALWEHVDGGVTGFSCHVGHTYSADSLLEEQGDAVERAIWTAVRMLEERAALVDRLADRMQRSGNTRSRRRFEEQARTAEQQARLIRRTLFEL